MHTIPHHYSYILILPNSSTQHLTLIPEPVFHAPHQAFHTHLHKSFRSRPSTRMGSKHASCSRHHSPQSSSEARLSAAWRASRPPMHAWRRHSSRSLNWQHLLGVARPPPPLRLRARLHQPPWRQRLLSVIGSPPRLPSSPRRHCFSFLCAATAIPLHRAAGGDSAGGGTDGKEMGCFAHDGLGLELGTWPNFVMKPSPSGKIFWA